MLAFLLSLGQSYTVDQQTVACLFHFIRNGSQPPEHTVQADEENGGEHGHERLPGDDFDTATLLVEPRDEDTPGVVQVA